MSSRGGTAGTVLGEGEGLVKTPDGLHEGDGVAIDRARGSQAHGYGQTDRSATNGELSSSYQSQGAVSEAPSDIKSTSTSSGNSSNEMTMFHVVFVMNPPPREHHVRVADMHDNVVKKFAKALKYEQASTGYVWTEAKKILDLRAQAKQNGSVSLTTRFRLAITDGNDRYTHQPPLVVHSTSLSPRQATRAHLRRHLLLTHRPRPNKQERRDKPTNSPPNIHSLRAHAQRAAITRPMAHDRLHARR